MRRSARTPLVVCLVAVVAVIGGCSSSSSSPTSDDDSATPDGSFCSLLIAFRTSNDALETEINSGDRARAEAAITRLVSQSDLLRRKAPAEIKADVDAVAVYVTGLDQLFARYEYDIDAFVGNEQASADFIALTTDEVESSLFQLQTYAATDCIGDPAASTTTVVAAPTVTPTVAPTVAAVVDPTSTTVAG